MKARMPNDNTIQAERLKMIEELMKHPLEADDRFSFRCKQCGKCCKDRNDIILSAFDLCRIAKHKNMELKDVIEKFGVLYIGDTSRIPLISLKMRKDNGDCPFLQNNRCTIHLGKPAACALFPLGRCAMREENGSSKIVYIVQPVKCGAKDEQHTPREWMTEFDLEESETWFSVWQETVFEISEWIKKRIDKIPLEKLNLTYGLMVNILYLRYDLDKPLAAQVENNKHYIMLMLNVLEQTINKEN